MKHRFSSHVSQIGFTCALRKFTKLAKPLLVYLRLQWFVNAIYIDDTFLMGSTLRDCSLNVQEMKKLFTGVGFIINKRKSIALPARELRRLAFNLNSRDMTVCLTSEKVANIQQMCADMKRTSATSIQNLAVLISKL